MLLPPCWKAVERSRRLPCMTSRKSSLIPSLTFVISTTSPLLMVPFLFFYIITIIIYINVNGIDVFRWMTGETDQTLAPGMIISARVIRPSDRSVSCRLEKYLSFSLMHTFYFYCFSFFLLILFQWIGRIHQYRIPHRWQRYACSRVALRCHHQR